MQRLTIHSGGMRKSIFLNRIGWTLAALVLCWPAHAQTPGDSHEPKLVAGWLENIVLAPSGVRLRAKLDTGAKTSSIHADELETFERDGETWVRFTTRDRKRNDGDNFDLERPLFRMAKIKRHGRPPVERPVIELDFCLNQRIYHTEFTLTDRGSFNYPVLLGRKVLEQGIVVDASMIFTQKTGRKACLKRAKVLSSSAREGINADNRP